jgi:hypothetical protein
VTDIQNELSRRTALKRIGIGAAAAWAAPTILSVGPAVAAGSPSPGCGNTPVATTFVPYGSDGWRYRQTANFSGDETGLKPFESVAGYSAGSEAFGNNAGGFGCATDAKTNWDVSTDLLVARNIVLPACASGVVVGVAIDNDIVNVYWDGVDIGGLQSHEGCASRDSFVYVVPDTSQGTHLLGIHARDRGGVTYLDIEVRGFVS